MKKLFTSFVLIISTNFSFSQNPSLAWARSMGGTNTENGMSVKVDASGNVYTTGDFQGTGDFDPGAGVSNLTSAGLEDVFIQKLNSLGNFVWARSIGGTSSETGLSLIVDASNNVYITGYFQGTVDFDPGAGVFNLTSAGSLDAYILKLDANGNFVWANRIGSTGDDRGQSIIHDASGNIYTTGIFGVTVDFDPGAGVSNLTSNGGEDIFIQKLDASGNFVWARSMGAGSNDYSYYNCFESSGSIYTTGTFQGTVDFDPGAGVSNLMSGGGSNIFIQKLDLNGNFVWGKSMGGTGIDYSGGITLDNAGNVLTIGYFSNTVDFDPGAGVFNITSAGSSDIFIQKLDASGNFIWTKSIGAVGADYGKSIVVDASNSIFTSGYYNGTVDFDPNAGVFNLTSNGNTDIFIHKIDGSGNFLWAGSMGAANFDVAYGLAIDIPGNLFMTGYYQNTVDFDPAASVANLTSAGLADVYVLKFNYCSSAPSQPGTIAGINSMCVGADATNYSFAPVAGAASYTWNLPSGWSGSSSTNTLSATPGTSGIFTVTASNACGASPQQTLAVTVNTLPIIVASTSNTMLCVGQSATLTAGGASTYTFNPGGAATSIVVSPTVTSTYTISGTSSQGCNNSSVFTQSVSTCAGVNQISSSVSEIQIYPNPFNNKITIGANGLKQTLQIFNAIGSLVYKTEIENEKLEIDLERVSSGIYFVRIGSLTKKIIKE